MIPGHGDVGLAVEAMRAGAYDFIPKPFSSERLVEVVRRALEKRALTLEVVTLRRTLGQREGIASRLIGRSPQMERVRQLIAQVCESPVDVLVHGETGTGKELVAKALHELSSRRTGPLVALNCGGMPDNLLDSELFGHEPGAFTGAQKRRIGKIEHAHGGTLFLDEVETMPMAMQIKLLRVLQERAVRPVGASQATPIDVRIISATHRDLEAAMASAQFREDLYYRLNVVSLVLPTLAERREDIALLANHFLDRLSRKYDKRLSGFAPEALKALTTAAWPGNVRQLYNVVEQVCALSTTPLVPLTLVQRALRTPSTQVLSFAEARQRFEREYLVGLLKMTDGNVADAARLAQRNRTEFYRLLQKHALTPGQFKQDAGDADDVVDERHE